jgi:hypothetical protein
MPRLDPEARAISPPSLNTVLRRVSNSSMAANLPALPENDL